MPNSASKIFRKTFKLSLLLSKYVSHHEMMFHHPQTVFCLLAFLVMFLSSLAAGVFSSLSQVSLLSFFIFIYSQPVKLIYFVLGGFLCTGYSKDSREAMIIKHSWYFMCCFMGTLQSAKTAGQSHLAHETEESCSEGELYFLCFCTSLLDMCKHKCFQSITYK